MKVLALVFLLFSASAASAFEPVLMRCNNNGFAMKLHHRGNSKTKTDEVVNFDVSKYRRVTLYSYGIAVARVFPHNGLHWGKITKKGSVEVLTDKKRHFTLTYKLDGKSTKKLECFFPNL